MIRNLSETELEQASGGFYIGGYGGVPYGVKDCLDISPYRVGQRGEVENSVSLPALTAIAPPEPAPRAEILTPPPALSGIGHAFVPICRDQEAQYPIHQEDGMNERWERYRPQQPAFRSRFINR